MKRFYTDSAIRATEGGWAVKLDGRPIRTPARAQLIVPTTALAQAIADEWAAQGQDIAPDSMPLTGIANAAIDFAAPGPASFAAPLAAYGESDLLCYRAPEADLAAHQAVLWNPILSWAEGQYGVEFTLVSGIIHQAQPPATITALAAALARHNAFTLAALSPIVTISGSLVIALALAEQAFDEAVLWAAALCDELWQEQRWGEDSEAVAARSHRRKEWRAAARFIMLASG